MKKIGILFLLFSLWLNVLSQGRPINKLTLETTYSYVEIHKTLRDLVDQADKSSYFDDTFFNTLLRKIVIDKQFSEKEKTQLFYLMQKNLGFAFVGINYLPPKQNYFNFFMGQAVTWQKTRSALKDLNYNISGLLLLVDSMRTKDIIVASNALLLACILNGDSAAKKLEYYIQEDVIMQCKNPDIFNHYVCMSASVKPNEAITQGLIKNIMNFKAEAFIEDAICALYTRNNPVGTIKEYVLKEQNPQNDLAIQTALCALYSKVPPATFEKSVKSFAGETKDKWKKDLCKNMAANNVPYNYSLTNKELIIPKKWEGVTLSLYTDGALISNGVLMEFDPN